MNSRLYKLAGLALALNIVGDIALPQQAYANTSEALEPWCKVDDPAAYRVARQLLIDAGQRDLSSIECPEKKVAGGTLPESLALPMPCGRTMIFQRIDVPVTNILDQVLASFGRRVEPKQETVQSVMSNGPWQAAVGGGFTLVDGAESGSSNAVSAPKKRAYYIGKYEVTAAQALLWRLGLLINNKSNSSDSGATCEAYDEQLQQLDLNNLAAAGGFSWYDAIEFSRDYMSWLAAQDAHLVDAGKAPNMPWEQGASGVVRLPTEAEWEYAARGGATEITPQSRSVRVPRIRDLKTKQIRSPEIEEVCADAPLRKQSLGAVGRKAPNLLGLYDTLCNAEEIVLNLFQPTRPDGLHGQIGGYMTKGGSSKFLRERNSVGMRREKELFRLDGEQRIDTNGLRLAIAAPVFVGRRDADAPFLEGLANEPLDEALLAGREKLLGAGVGLARESRAAVSREVEELKKQIQDQSSDRAELEQQVAELQVRLDSLNTELSEKAVEAARQRVRAGVVAASLIDRVGRNLYNFMQQLQKVAKRDAKYADPKQWPELKLNNDRITAAFDLYLALQGELATESETFVNDQLSAAESGLSGASLASFEKYIAMLQRHQKEIRVTDGFVTEQMRDRWLKEIDSQREARAQRFPEYL